MLLTKVEFDFFFYFFRLGTRIEQHYKGSSLTFVIQDGPEAGQTVGTVNLCSR